MRLEDLAEATHAGYLAGPRANDANRIGSLPIKTASNPLPLSSAASDFGSGNDEAFSLVEGIEVAKQDFAIRVPSSTHGVFAREMVHDLRAVITQARTGIVFSERAATFIKEVSELQDKFAHRLARIVDREMVQFAVYETSDGMQGIRDVWMRAVEDSRSWATASKQMSLNMARLAAPLDEHRQLNAKRLDLIVQENDRLSRPILDQQSSIVRKQLRCNKAVSPMMHPSYNSLSSKKKEKITHTARAEVERYLNEIDKANAWVSDVTNIARPGMLNSLQKMEEERIDRTRRVLHRYSRELQRTASAITQVGSKITQRLAVYHVEDDINSFIDSMRARPVVDREYLAPFLYRLPFSLQELGLADRAQKRPQYVVQPNDSFDNVLENSSPEDHDVLSLS